MSLNLKVQYISAIVGNTVDIYFAGTNDIGSIFCIFYSEHEKPTEETGMYRGPLYKPPSILIRLEERDYKWKNEGFELTDWVQHFKGIFHRPKLASLTIKSDGFHLEDIVNHFKDFQSFDLSVARNFIDNRDFAKHAHKIQQLNAAAQLFSEKNVNSSILIQNFDYIGIGGDAILGLNDLLTCGSKILSFSDLKITAKEFNRFLKLWIKGSNSRMEMFIGDFKTNADNIIDTILKDLNTRNIEPGKKRYFESRTIEQLRQVESGWDIFRQDGTEATINIFCSLTDVYFGMFVWHSHCVVDNLTCD